MKTKKRGDAAWEYCVALFPVIVLTTTTENREQEVMLSSPVSLAPPMLVQSRCHQTRALIPVTPGQLFEDFLMNTAFSPLRGFTVTCKKYISWKKYLL